MVPKFESFQRTDSYSFALEKLSDGEYIGRCSIIKIDWKNSVAEVGIFLGRPYWSQGYGTDAMRVLVRFIFNEMNMNKIKLHVFSFNERAKRVYEKIGFKVEGILRQELFREGRYHDVIVMGLLKSEWEDLTETDL